VAITTVPLGAATFEVGWKFQVPDPSSLSRVRRFGFLCCPQYIAEFIRRTGRHHVLRVLETRKLANYFLLVLIIIHMVDATGNAISDTASIRRKPEPQHPLPSDRRVSVQDAFEDNRKKFSPVVLGLSCRAQHSSDQSLA
jgi:hypothetical protein